MSIWPKTGRAGLDAEGGPRLKRRVLHERLASSLLNESLASGERHGIPDPELQSVTSVGDEDPDEADVEAETVATAGSLVASWEVSEARRLDDMSSLTAFCRSADRGS